MYPRSYPAKKLLWMSESLLNSDAIFRTVYNNITLLRRCVLPIFRKTGKPLRHCERYKVYAIQLK